MRVLFAGTPAVALPSLEAIRASRHELVGVLTRPDAPAGRGRHLTASPVARRAAELGLPVLEPTRMRDPGLVADLRALAPDCGAVTAFGGLLPAAVLAVPRHGFVNLHFSLLPAWRGAAPVQRALLAGDDVVGATTFRIVENLDAGPVYDTLTEPVRPTDTAGDLLARLADAGAQLLVRTLDGIAAGTLRAAEQSADGVSLAPKVTVADAEVDWAAAADAVDRRIRACTPAPGAWTTVRGARVKLWPVRLPAAAPAGIGRPLPPGVVTTERHRVLVGTGTDPVELTDVHPAGRRRMAAADWARGTNGLCGERLGR